MTTAPRSQSICMCVFLGFVSSFVICVCLFYIPLTSELKIQNENIPRDTDNRAMVVKGKEGEGGLGAGDQTCGNGRKLYTRW